MSRPKNTIAQQLGQADVAINNTLADPETLALVAPRGYTADKLARLKDLYDRALAAVKAKEAVKGDKEYATDQLDRAYRAAHLAYQDLAATARRVFHVEPARLTALGLTSDEPHDTAGFIRAAYVLFDNAALPELAPDLAERGYPAAFLAAERGKIVAFDQANQAQEAAKGAAKGGATDQATLLAQLHTDLMAYLDVAEIALRGRADLQTKIGLKITDRKAAARQAVATRAARKAAKMRDEG